MNTTTLNELRHLLNRHGRAEWSIDHEPASDFYEAWHFRNARGQHTTSLQRHIDSTKWIALGQRDNDRLHDTPTAALEASLQSIAKSQKQEARTNHASPRHRRTAPHSAGTRTE